MVVMTLCSMATSLWRPLTSAAIGDIITDPKTRELAMQSLYFIVNVGCAVGPMLGVWLGLTGILPYCSGLCRIVGLVILGI